MNEPLLRGDLVKQHWRSYLLVCVVAVAAHIAWLRFIGIAPSTDFAVRYDPGARQLLAALGFHRFGVAPSFSIGAYGWARIGYISFIAACYAVFGASLGAAVYPQVALVWLVYPLAFHLLLHITGKHKLALGAMLMWLTYYDGYQWHFRAVPDAIYRLLFLAAFFVLLRLWQTEKRAAFVSVLLVAVALGSSLRIETVLYPLPLLVILYRRFRKTHPVALWTGMIGMVVLMWLAMEPLTDIAATFFYMQARGFILPGSGFEVPGVTEITAPASGSIAAWLLFFGHLGVLRLIYAATPLPALWSGSHRIYYAAYLTPAYVLAAFGFAAALRTRDAVFLTCFWIFIAGDILQVFVAVDPSMRYAYTPQMFLFFCAAMGWPALMSKMRPQWA